MSIEEQTIYRPPLPLTLGHIQFNEMGINPPPYDRVMDISNFTFNQLKIKIVHERKRCFLNSPHHPVTINTKRVITLNSRNNPRVVVALNETSTKPTKENTNFLMEENEQLTKELVIAMQQEDHLIVDNQILSSTSSSRKEFKSVIIEEINRLEYTMK